MWDPLESAVFLYYLSRGMTLELVADFMRRKCKMPGEPRSTEDLEHRLSKNKLPSDTTTWEVDKINRLILGCFASLKFDWEDFLVMVEFDSKDRAILEVSEEGLSTLNACSNQSTQQENLLESMEAAKRERDPPVTEAQQRKRGPPVIKAQQKPTSKGPLSSGGMTSLTTSLPEQSPSLLASTSILGSDSGTGYSRGTGAARGPSGGYGSSLFLPVGGPLAGSSMAYHSAGAEYTVMDNFGQERSYQSSQYPDTIGQPAPMSTANKRPATEELEGEDPYGREPRKKAAHETYRDDHKEPQEKRESRADRKVAKEQADRERQARVDQKVAKDQAERERWKKQEAEADRKIAQRVAAYKPYSDDTGRRQ